MKKNAALVLIIVTLLIIFGVYYWANSMPGMPEIVKNEGLISRLAAENPAQPVVLTGEAKFISESTAALAGTVSPRGLQTAYWYEYGMTDLFGNSTNPQLIGSGYLTYQAPAVVTGLESGTAYYYRLVAENQHGKVYGETRSFATNVNDPPKQHLLPSVETQASTGVSETSATINGHINPRGLETRYWFEYGETVALGNTTASAVAGTGSARVLVSANLRGIKPETAYYYRLNAQNPYGTVHGDIFVFATPSGDSTGQENLPMATTSPASGVGRTIATLNGQVNPNGTATVYRFEYGPSTVFGSFNLNQSTETRNAGNGTAAIDVSSNLRGLESGATYYYQLVSENEFGMTRGTVYTFTTQRP